MSVLSRHAVWLACIGLEAHVEHMAPEVTQLQGQELTAGPSCASRIYRLTLLVQQPRRRWADP